MKGLDRRALRYGVEYLAFRAAGAIFRRLGMERASALSGAVWRLIAPRLKRHRRALANLARALPERTEAERERIALAMWDNLGRTFAEAFFLPELVAGGRVTFENQAAFDTWRALPGGKVACAAHLANWEIAIAPATLSGLEPMSIYKRLRNPLVDAEVHRLRAFLYPGGLLPREPAVPRQALKLVREGGTVGLLVDQRDPTGAPVPFFGQDALSTTFPAMLSLAAGSPLLVSCMRRLPGVRFVQTYVLVQPVETGDRRADAVAATAAVQATFERFVREWPEQWMWAHRRWG